MKTYRPPYPKLETGRQYWRGLDELADTPAFKEWVEREFPEGASECTDPLTRRNFVKIMSASFLLAGVGLTGCRRPVEAIRPFAKAPENYVHGAPQYYATSMPSRGQALPLVVKSYDGRPIKVEGNSLHPQRTSGTDHFAQASILSLYDPDRAMRFTHNGNDVPLASVVDMLNQMGQRLAAEGGKGLCFLMEQSNSPSRDRLQGLLSQKLPQARWFVYEPIDLETERDAASLVFGKTVVPQYRYHLAQVILSLDSDFLGSEANNQEAIHGFAQGRKVEKAGSPMNRLYVVEGLMSLTGANADHRLRVPAGEVSAIAALVAGEILRQSEVPGSRELAALAEKLADAQVLKTLSARVKKEDPQWLNKWARVCAQDLQAAKGRSLVVAGHRQPLAVHILALAINVALGNSGNAATAPLAFTEDTRSKAGNIQELAKLLNANQVQTLVILGGNPVYNAPAELDWEKTQRKAQTVLRLGQYEDETYAVSDWHLPSAHYLESWGDARSCDGIYLAIQPLIAPLFGGLTELELLARLGGLDKINPYEIARETFKGIAAGEEFEGAWKRYLHDGFRAKAATQPSDQKFDWAKAAQSITTTTSTATPSAQGLEVIFYRDYSVDDGRYNNNGWLQELPDPITKLTWDNAILVSRQTAEELGLGNEELVTVKLGSRSIQGPIWIQPGMADYVLGLALGYGRPRTGRVGQKAGFNAYPLRTSAAMHIAMGATVQKAGQVYPLSCTQNHWSMEGRAIVREANLKQYQAQPDCVTKMNEEAPPTTQPLYPNPLDKLKLDAAHQWGMAIDLNACVGCSACLVACQSENNIPIVGKEQVGKGREMHWVRIDRYYTGDPAKEKDHHPWANDAAQAREKWIDDPQVITQPMMCQHCEAAPCENVCPVNATVHNDEGLNLMVYNRCVGTRYCSNNCPYKVRRFNFFDFNKRPIQDHKLYLGPLAKKPADEWEILKLAKNPDVTVRMRGVMEKCTFCVQRIEQAKIARKIQAGASGNVEVADGVIVTACQQACPAEAIVFGNVADPNSQVSKMKKQERNYAVLEFLGVKPRLSYLARIRNPNSAMPDYYELPLSTQEYREHHGSEEEAGGAYETGGHEGRTAPQHSEKGAH